ARARVAEQVESRRSHPFALVVPEHELAAPEGDLAADIEADAVEIGRVRRPFVLLADDARGEVERLRRVGDLAVDAGDGLGSRCALQDRLERVEYTDRQLEAVQI